MSTRASSVGPELGSPATSAPADGEPSTLAADDAGAVMTEYAVLVALVGLGSVAALIAVGAPLLRFFLMQQAWLLLPFP